MFVLRERERIIYNISLGRERERIITDLNRKRTSIILVERER